MTVLIHIGRRVPRSWLRRQSSKIAGLMTFQENLWLIIKQSMNLAKKKATASGKIKFIMNTIMETEDMNYQLEWMRIVISGTPEQEKEEYEEAMKMYSPVSKIFKKDIEKDDKMLSHFKSKILDGIKVEEAYAKGYGSVGDNNLANKLLEMGILTHMELIKDYDSRPIEIQTDF